MSGGSFLGEVFCGKFFGEVFELMFAGDAHEIRYCTRGPTSLPAVSRPRDLGVCAQRHMQQFTLNEFLTLSFIAGLPPGARLFARGGLRAHPRSPAVSPRRQPALP